MLRQLVTLLNRRMTPRPEHVLPVRRVLARNGSDLTDLRRRFGGGNLMLSGDLQPVFELEAIPPPWSLKFDDVIEFVSRDYYIGPTTVASAERMWNVGAYWPRVYLPGSAAILLRSRPRLIGQLFGAADPCPYRVPSQDIVRNGEPIEHMLISRKPIRLVHQ